MSHLSIAIVVNGETSQYEEEGTQIDGKHIVALASNFPIQNLLFYNKKIKKTKSFCTLLTTFKSTYNNSWTSS